MPSKKDLEESLVELEKAKEEHADGVKAAAEGHPPDIVMGEARRGTENLSSPFVAPGTPCTPICSVCFSAHWGHRCWRHGPHYRICCPESFCQSLSYECYCSSFCCLGFAFKEDGSYDEQV